MMLLLSIAMFYEVILCFSLESKKYKETKHVELASYWSLCGKVSQEVENEFN